jgi:hypothetical protein
MGCASWRTVYQSLDLAAVSWLFLSDVHGMVRTLYRMVSAEVKHQGGVGVAKIGRIPPRLSA